MENIARIPPDLFGLTCQHILNHLQGQARGVDSAEISDRFQKSGISLDQDAVHEVIRFLLLTFRSAGKSNLSGDALVSRLGEGISRWPKDSLQVIQQLWSEQGAQVHTEQEAQAMLSIGQLVDMQWRLGMAVSSDTCRSLNSPYVSLLLKVADTSGLISQRCFEMTVPQFQNFHRQFKELAAVLETV